jgi:AcrR family transcriptional regulator
VISKKGAPRRGDALREHILWSAQEVFLEAGFERASMDAVAARAGTTKRTLYAHFKNKQALFLAVFELIRGYFLGRLKTPAAYAGDPAKALVLFCGRFLETMLYQGAIRTCRVCAAEAERFPDQAANYCYVIFTEVENRIAVYVAASFNLSAKAGAEAAQTLLGRVLYPRFTRTLFGVDPWIETFDENGISPRFDLGPIRRAVAEMVESFQ